MKKNEKKHAAMRAFQTGQIWRMDNSHVCIGEVGKTLVEYKLLKGDVKRGPIRLTGKPALQDFLKSRRATLQ